MRVVCAMSGGVDSSATASMLIEAGHEVVGMTMRLYDASGDERKGRGGTCCSPAEVDLARRVCAQLGIPHYLVDERDRFAQDVIVPFARDYAAGRTPNPCTRCNQNIKFEPLLRRARALGADVMATGHYARNEFGAALRRGVDPRKDQSYFLFSMGRNALRQVWFPLGSWNKDDVRQYAAHRSLPNYDAPDSQELCFVPGGNHGDVVERELAKQGLSTQGLAPGPVLDQSGAVIGEHQGIHRVTVGQRRGFQTRGVERKYVLRIVPEQRAVVVGDLEDAKTQTMQVAEVQRLSLPDNVQEVHAWIQVRHKSAPARGRVVFGDGSFRVDFDGAIPSAAPGQAAVVYDDDERVLAGGWITSAS